MKIQYLPASKFGALNEAEVYAFNSVGYIPVWVNDVYLDNFFRPERIQIWYGGSGGGKSDAKATELLMKCLLQPFCRVMFTRKIYDSIRMSQFQLFKDVIARYKLEPYFKVVEDGMRITCLENGNMLFARGLDDVDKITSIADVTDIWIEEPIDRRGSITSSDFTELNRRLRCPKASNHIHFTFNPISKDSWINDYFFKSGEYAAYTLRTTYLDNAFSPADQKRQFEILKIKKPEEYKVYALGEWGSLKQGLIYPEYQIIEDYPTDCRKNGYGLDWGFYPDPWALIRCGIKFGELYLDELVYENNHTSDSRTKLMVEYGIAKGQRIIADRNPEAIEEMRKKGWSSIIPADKGPGSVKAGIDVMKGYKIHITKRSKNLKKELDNYSWKIDPKTDEPTGEPIDKFNHCFVAGTLVLTDRGQKEIQDIAPGDFVLTEKGFRPVIQTHINTPTEPIKTYEVETNSGSFSVSCTVNHKVKINDKWQEIEKLKPGDKVIIAENSLSISTKKPELAEVFVLRVTEKDLPNQEVYDIGVYECHSYTANGLLVHNCLDAARYWVMSENGTFVRIVS